MPAGGLVRGNHQSYSGSESGARDFTALMRSASWYRSAISAEVVNSDRQYAERGPELAVVDPKGS